MKISALNSSAIAAILLLAGSTAMAPALAGAKQEFATAIDHSGYAAKADSLDKVHLHLHHVINCIEGPDGADFDASAGDPCKGQGNGLLNDMDSSKAEQKAMVERARDLAVTGTRVDVLEPGHDVAKAARGILKKTWSVLANGSGM